MVDHPPTEIHPYVYRGDNYGGVMAPLFVVVFPLMCVFVLFASLREGRPPLWFAVLWISGVLVMLGITTLVFASKIVVSHSLISWSYLGRRGGSALVEDIDSVDALGWYMPGWVCLKDGRRIWIQTTPGFRNLREAIRQVSPRARV